MQQFRPLPRFDTIEEAEPVEPMPTPITDPIPTLQHTTDPIPTTHTRATAHMPIVLLSGPHPTPDTGRLASVAKRPFPAEKRPSLTSALRATISDPNKSPERLLVIPAARKRKKGATRKRLNPHLRQFVMFVVTLVIIIGALATLVPLSDNQNGNIFSSIGTWIHDAQMDWQIQAHQGGQNTMPTALNGPGLPFMAIPNSQYVPVAEQDAVDAGISPVYFVRQINQESGFNPSAVSVTNAEGIAQFEPSTAAGLGINPWDPVQALRGAAQLMARYYHQYGDYAKALGAYNAGVGAVQSASYACGMNWLACMPGQTRNYVYRIMGI